MGISPKYIMWRLFGVVRIQFEQAFILPVIADSQTDDASDIDLFHLFLMPFSRRCMGGLIPIVVNCSHKCC
jgi:hypothetical protein